MNGLSFTLDCIECAGELTKINGTQQSRWAVCAVVRCCSCGREYVVDAHLSAMRTL